MNFLKFLVNIITVLAFTAEPLLAAQAKANFNKRFNQFLQLTEIHKRKVTLKEFYEKTKSFIPLEARKQIEEVVAKNGDQVLPQFQVSKVKYKGKELPQISFVEGKNSGIITLLDGYYNKKNNDVFRFGEQTFTIEDFNDLPKLAQSLETQASTTLKKERTPASVGGGEVGLIPLDIDFWNDSSEAFKNEFRTNIIELIRIQLYLQDDLLKSPNKKTSSLQLFVQPALATTNRRTVQAGDVCISKGGWFGKYNVDTGVPNCNNLTSSTSPNCLKCQISGKDPLWKQFESCAATTSLGGHQPCNPAFYGFRENASAGKYPICIAAQPTVAEAIAGCGTRRADWTAYKGAHFEGQYQHLQNSTDDLYKICSAYVPLQPRRIHGQPSEPNLENADQVTLCRHFLATIDKVNTSYCKAAAEKKFFDKPLGNFCRNPKYNPEWRNFAAAAPPPAAAAQDSGVAEAPAAPAPVTPPPAAPAPVIQTPTTTSSTTTTTQASAPPPPAPGGGSAPKSSQGVSPAAECDQIETMLKSAEAVPQCSELAKPEYQNCGIMTGCNGAKKVWLKKGANEIKCTTGDNTTNSDIHKCECAPNGYFDTGKEIYICRSDTTAAGSAVTLAPPKKEANWLDKNWGGIFKVILAIFTAGLVYAITDNSAKAYDKNVKKIIDANPPTPPIPLPPPRTAPGKRQ